MSMRSVGSALLAVTFLATANAHAYISVEAIAAAEAERLRAGESADREGQNLRDPDRQDLREPKSAPRDADGRDATKSNDPPGRRAPGANERKPDQPRSTARSRSVASLRILNFATRCVGVCGSASTNTT